jgi:hypothetical protein
VTFGSWNTNSNWRGVVATKNCASGTLIAQS